MTVSAGVLAPGPLVVTDALAAVGTPTWIVVGASVLLALYHFHTTMRIAAQIGTALKVGAVVVALLVVAASGLVPGFDIVVEAEQAGGWLLEQARTLWDLLTRIPEVVR